MGKRREEESRQIGRKIIDWLKRRKKILLLFSFLIIFWRLLILAPSDVTDQYCSTLLAEDGSLLAARIAEDGQWRFPQQDSVPQKFETALLHFEDEHFYYHPGINLLSIARAFRDNISAGKIKNGGSTITMQLSRMILKNRNRSIWNKLREMFYAIRLEVSFSKSEILNMYCARAPFGGNVVGLEAASWRYFGRSAALLSWSESATLAVLPNAPGLIFPGRNQRALLQKRNRLLQKLFEKNKIDQATLDLAYLESLPTKPFPIPSIAPHLLDRCISDFGKSKAYTSTIKSELQIQINALLNAHVQNLKQNQINNACVLVADIVTGKVVAYVGNSSTERQEDENFVDIIRAKRSTGSILKPFLYAFMLSENRILPGSLLEDVPTRIGAYSPKNFSLNYDGLVPANQAIARSLNVPAVKMLQNYGVARFHQRLKQLGFTSFAKPSEHYGLSLILGGGEASLFELAGAYASMGRSLLNYSNVRKKYADESYHPLLFLKNQVRETRLARLNADLVKASAIWFTFQAMTDLLRPQDYIGYAQFLNRHRIAWKTGTSFGFRDAWAIGLDGQFLVAVWAGNADGEGRPELTGTAAAAPLMFSVFNLLTSRTWFPKPFADLERTKICLQSGFRLSENCEESMIKEYPSGAEHSPQCSFHQIIHLDSTEKFRVGSHCYPVAAMHHKKWFVATPLQEFYYRHHSMRYKPLPAYFPGCQTDNKNKRLEIVYPHEGFSIYVPRQASGLQEDCVFSATHKQADMNLYWHLDGRFIGQTFSEHQIQINPSAGKHTLLITDEDGESATCTFEVLEKPKAKK